MNLTLNSLVPDPETLLALEVEELAGVLLMHLNSRDDRGADLHHSNFFVELRNYPIYPTRKDEVNRALMEAWDWLANEGFLAMRGDDHSRSGVFVTRRGQRLKSREDFAAYLKANLLPKGQLHPLLASKVYPAFLRGDYDTAIFQAFKEVEVAVRQAGKFPHDLVGDKLMRAAFATAENSQPVGPLTDTQLPLGEQKALAHLFVGAFGVYRNSTGHRHVIAEPVEAAEVIMFASQLLRIVDSRKQQQAGEAHP
ncbi:MAG: TIGR02391 family protein [Acidobacteria bacterium]|nr:TIGR02391 family protein [Acidobacteriota bacterium]